MRKELSSKAYPHQIAFNAILHIAVFMENDYTKEEMKMVHETQKIMDENIKVSPTAVRIPVFRSHSESINIETEKPFNVENIVKLLSNAPGAKLMDNPDTNSYPLATVAEGKDDALNTIQIGELLIKGNLV